MLGEDGRGEAEVERESVEGKVTFPMRPNKRRLLVRSSTSKSASKQQEQRTSNNDLVLEEESKRDEFSCGSPGGKSTGRRRVAVSKSISVKDLHIDEATFDQDGSAGAAFLTPFGRHAASPARKAAAEPSPVELTTAKDLERASDFCRYDASGAIIPYSILGDVEQLLKAGGSTSQHASTAGSKALSRSVGGSSQQLSRSMADSSAAGSISGTNSSGVIESGSISKNADPQSGGSQSLGYLERVRANARAEIERREQVAQAKLSAEREERMVGMLGHERLLFDRQERTLALHHEWQEEWARFKSAMCKLSGKKVEDLVVSRADDFRERTEEYNFINAATPHHQKHGSEYWMMSLRGMGTRYVAVGNLFSGLFCPVRETSNIEMEMIRNPKNIGVPLPADLVDASANANSKSKHSGASWRDSKILNRRKKQLAHRLEEIRPNEISKTDAESLVIQGEALLEWAYVSVEKHAMDEREAEEKSEQLRLEDQRCSQALEAANKQAEAEVQSEATASAPGPRLEVVVTTADGKKSPESGFVSLRANTGALACATAHIKNVGTTALYFSWSRNEQTRAATTATECEERFFCSLLQGVVLPGQTQQVSFVFKSSTAGAWKNVWTLETRPSTSSAAVPLTFRGIAVCPDNTRPAREALDDALEAACRSLAAERQAALDEANRKPDEVPASPEELRRRYEAANRALGLFFSPGVQEPLRALALEVFQAKHSLDMEMSQGQIEDAVAADLAQWLQSPSLVVIKSEIARISRGEPLRPSCRAPTIVSEISNADGLCNLEDLSPDATEITVSKEEQTLPLGYLERETERLAGIAAELDERLMSLARETVRREEVSSPFWAFATACIENIIDRVVDACEGPVIDEEDPEQVAAAAAAAEESQDGAPTAVETATASALEAVAAFEAKCDEFRAVQRTACAGLVNPKSLLDSAGRFSAFDRESTAADAESQDAGDDESCQQTEEALTSSALFGGKRVLIEVDVDIAPAEDDADALDMVETARKLARVAQTVDWVAKAFPKSIALVGRRTQKAPAYADDDEDEEEDELTVPSLALVCEELAAKLGREVVFVEELDNEEVANTFLDRQSVDDGSEGEDDEDEDEGDAALKEPVAASQIPQDIDEIPVFMVQSLANDSVSRNIGVIQEFAQVIVRDSVDGLAHDFVINESLQEQESQVRTFIGPNLEAELVKLEALLQKDHVFIIGDAPNSYPPGEKEDSDVPDDEDEDNEDDEEDEDDEDEDDEDDEDDDDDDENGQETGQLVDTAEIGGCSSSKDDAASQSGTSEAGSSESLSSSNESISSGSSSSGHNDKIIQPGFSDQINLISGILDKHLAKSVVLVGVFAEAFAHALLEMGAPVQRIISNDYRPDSLEIPNSEQAVRNEFECHTYRQAERENMRILSIKARSMGVPIKLVLADQIAPQAPSEIERACFEKAVDTNSSVIVLTSGFPSSLSTSRALLRMLGKRIKNDEDDTRVTICSAQLLNAVEYINEGSADDEIEQEAADELAREQENAPEPDEDDEGEDEEETEKQESPEDEPDKHGLENEAVTSLNANRSLAALINDQSIRI